jgi:hypothetical protein
VSRRRVRSAAYRARRQQRHAGRHYFVDELLPGGGEPDPYLAGAQATEYRRGVAVSVDTNFVGISDRRSRRPALKAAEPEGGASPAEEWAHWKETSGGFKCEELAHG